ncbi:DUF1064 domain-containing protein [Desulfoscipio geothermicus]|uniref:DUF1064 domain-containing protein n=1 Tax=Desulfoscipio geothermicus DSM 3669 TaxID=1121426 RepID=A0A1I6EC52_9FIRM|nr:DUF1064 domain-containing protein [Desulfoscipio geothermicus]SFR15326.1 Protein of unknown function [Desulfoscipio geothermicus DSM 3669]
MTRISQARARELGLLPPRESKYRSRKATVDGITFDSRKEARKYEELKLLKRAGEIVDFELQPEFELQPGFRDRDGNWVRPIKYRADFLVRYHNGRVVVIDTKGYRTKEYAIKRKMLLYRYPGIEFVEE